MTTILLALAAVPLIVAMHDLLLRPVIRRQAVRNVVRHRGETVLVVAGTLLGTAIITASFVVGDSFAGSIRDIARTNLGPVDEVVVVEPDQLDRVLEAIDEPTLLSVDGVMVLRSASASVVSNSPDPLGEPRARVFGIDTSEAGEFGADPGATGFDNVAQPSDGEVLLGKEVADTVAADIGDSVTVHLLGNETTLDVVGIVDDIGLGGRRRALFVSTSQFDTLSAGGNDDPRVEILVSNAGGVFAGAELTGPVTAELEDRVEGLDVEVETWKADLLEDAKAEGTDLTTLFAGIGSFAVIAGILLLINLFTMLAEERRTDLGVMRALGTKRSVVVRQLGLEGSLYATVSAVLGVAAGVGVGWLITQFARSLLADDGLELSLFVESSSVVYGATIGLIISLATVWITSTRIARLNIIRAIRQLPEPATAKGARRERILGGFGLTLGGALTALGLSGSSDIAAIAGPAIVAFSLIPILGPSMSRKAVVTIASVAAMAWGLFAFTLLPDVLDDSGMSGFVAQGLVLVGGAVLLVTTHNQFWIRMAPDGIATRLGLANSLARRTRTALLLSMYALVIFMITFMSVFSSVFTRQTDDFAAGTSAGHDMVVDSSRGNPLTARDLLAVDGVTAVAVIDRSWLDFEGSWSGGVEGWTIAGIEPSLFANGEFDVIDRAPRFESDSAALRAVFDDPNAIVVPEFFLENGGSGPGGTRASAGDTVEATHADSGRTRQFEVVAVTAADWVFTGPLVSAEVLDGLVLGDSSATRAYVSVDSGFDVTEMTARLDATFLANGAVSTSFVDAVEEEVQETAGFIRILSGYLGLGLVIGIAGLGVVLVRGVRERRREIGMLRAIGVESSTIRSMFLIEAGFIGSVGGLLGTGLGLLTGYQVVTQSTLFGATSVSYATPWTIVAIVVIGPLLASLLAASVPATRASRLRPSEALRSA